MGDCVYLNEATPSSPFQNVFRACGRGPGPRRPWLVDDLQGTLSHILHPCQVGAGGREAGSTRLVCQGTENSTAGALGGGRRTRTTYRPQHPSRSKSGGSIGGSAGPGPCMRPVRAAASAHCVTACLSSVQGAATETGSSSLSVLCLWVANHRLSSGEEEKGQRESLEW